MLACRERRQHNVVMQIGWRGDDHRIDVGPQYGLLPADDAFFESEPRYRCVGEIVGRLAHQTGPPASEVREVERDQM